MEEQKEVGLRKLLNRVPDKEFHLSLVIGSLLVLDVIILFILSIIELNGVSHGIMLTISFVIEFLMTLFVILKSNIRSSIIFYILLLTSPVFLNLIAMGMYYFTNKLPFTPTVLILFRSGYDLQGHMLNTVMRFVISFRVPALIAILISSIVYLYRKGKQEE